MTLISTSTTTTTTRNTPISEVGAFAMAMPNGQMAVRWERIDGWYAVADPLSGYFGEGHSLNDAIDDLRWHLRLFCEDVGSVPREKVADYLLERLDLFRALGADDPSVVLRDPWADEAE